MTREEKERIQQKLHRAADAHLNAYGGNLYYEGVARGLEQAAGIVGKLKCKEEPHWIPCSERMPEENNWLGGSRRKFSDEVLVSVVNYDDDEILTHISQTIEGKWALNFASRCKVIAWMPLPKPYEEGMEADGTD